MSVHLNLIVTNIINYEIKLDKMVMPYQIYVCPTTLFISVLISEMALTTKKNFGGYGYLKP